MKLTAFIPFCFFGEDLTLLGKNVNNFQVPVCDIFRMKIVNGQVCYEADINQYKNKATRNALIKGLSLIIDTNDEFDVKNLLIRNDSESDHKLEEISLYTHLSEEPSGH